MRILFRYCRNVKSNLKFHNAFQRYSVITVRRIHCSKINKNERISNDGEETEKKEDSDVIKKETKEYPEEPTTCCMSGCANCVWLEYAEKLSEYYKDGGEKAIKEINEKVTDANMKAFLFHEIRMRSKQ